MVGDRGARRARAGCRRRRDGAARVQVEAAQSAPLATVEAVQCPPGGAAAERAIRSCLAMELKDNDQ